MLTQLHIENIAVIERVDIDFDQGFCALTGETGAGKSIIIDSINLLLGGRANKDLIRSGCAKAYVSACFFSDDPGYYQQLSEQFGFELEEDGQLLIQREITVDGKSSARINGRPVSVTVLKNIGKELIHIHGQHDNQALLNASSHIKYLDAFAHNEAVLQEYRECYRHCVALEKQIRMLDVDERERSARIDLLTYQVAEIEQAELSEGEEEQLRQRKKILANAEKITENLGALHQLLQTSEGSAYDILARADRFFAELSECSAEFESLYHQFVDAYENLKDVTEEIADKYDRFEYDDRELDEIEERLDLIRSLKRKYGDTFEQIQTYLQQAQKELNSIQHADEQIQALVKEQDAALEQLQQKADRLTRSRQEAAEILQKKIVDNLAFLEMPNVRFHVSIRSCDPKNNGVDQVEFLLSPNLGEALKPLSEIASGGELSRIMLSIQNVLADTDHTETLIFDEIDTGVSGRAAQKIGIKLGQMAQVCQVITITHLAQIACYADRHYLIRKNHDEHRTYTEVVLLNHAQRVQELARILGGIHITPSVLSAAEEMLKQKTE